MAASNWLIRWSLTRGMTSFASSLTFSICELHRQSTHYTDFPKAICVICGWLLPMQALTRKRSLAIGWRARVPLIARIVAFTLLASGIAVVGVSYYKLRNVEK